VKGGDVDIETGEILKPIPPMMVRVVEPKKPVP
jgi:hypothetical protein